VIQITVMPDGMAAIVPTYLKGEMLISTLREYALAFRPKTEGRDTQRRTAWQRCNKGISAATGAIRSNVASSQPVIMKNPNGELLAREVVLPQVVIIGPHKIIRVANQTVKESVNLGIRSGCELPFDVE
jgi:hypothetical protein